MIAYVSGFFIIGCLPHLGPDLGLWLLLLLGLSWLRAGPPHLSLVVCGCLVAWLYGTEQLAHRLSAKHAGDFQLTGEVVGLPEHYPDSMRFTIRVIRLAPLFDADTDIAALRQVQLRWYQPTHKVTAGDVIQAKVRLKPPHGLYNPAAGDSELRAFINRIDARGYVRTLIAYQAEPSVNLDRLRGDLLAWLEQRLAQHPRALASLRALWLGDKSALTEHDWLTLRASGTTHLMVVSGLHIGVLVGLGWWLGRGLASLVLLGREGQCSPFLWPFIGAVGLSGAYMLLAGMSLPTLRAWLMAAIMLSGYLTLRRISVWRRWWASMAIVLTLFPLAFYQSGFWLSFIAVATLLYLVAHLRQQGQWAKLIHSQWLIFLIVGPLTVWCFSALSLSAPLVNLLAIPAVSALVLASPAALLLEVIGIHWGVDSLVKLLEWGWYGLDWLADYAPVLLWQPPKPGGIALGFALLGSVLVLLPLSAGVRLTGLLCWLPLVLKAPAQLPEKQFQAWVFDVGQGTAVLVQTRHHRLLYDTGAAYRNGGSALAQAVLPYFRQQGITQLDRLVVSHNDNDHAGGVARLLKQLDVDQIDAGMPASLIQRGVEQKVSYCPPDGAWQWDGVSFRYRHLPATAGDSSNDRSCILQINAAACGLLLSGDASQSVETAISTRLTKVSWLLAGHHGSADSTGDTLLQATEPDAVLFSNGYLNRYGHPHASVLERVRQAGAQSYRTDHHGALLLQVNGAGHCQVTTWREQQKGYWSQTLEHTLSRP